MRKLVGAKLDDEKAERVKRSHQDAIHELQRLVRDVQRKAGSLQSSVDALNTETVPTPTPTVYIPANVAQQHNVAAAGNQYFSTVQNNPGGYWGSSTAGIIRVEFPLSGFFAPGDRIETLDVDIKQGNSAGETVTARIYQLSRVGLRTQISGTKTSGTTGLNTTIGWTSSDSGIPLDLAEDVRYVVSVDLAATSSLGEARCYGLIVNG